MTSQADVFISDWSAANALGANREEISRNLKEGGRTTLGSNYSLADGRQTPVGPLPFEPEPLPGRLSFWESRNNRLAWHCTRPLQSTLDAFIDLYGRDRIGVVVGTSTTGTSDTEAGLVTLKRKGHWPSGYRYERQELGDVSNFLAEATNCCGPTYTISTACTSGKRAVIAGSRLIQSGLCDAVLCGGIDTLCALTLNGFAALNSVSSERCLPFSNNRAGINIGEGGAMFVLSRRPSNVRLAGWGESADAYHISAPDPGGGGARLAIQRALEMAGVGSRQIGYINLHGTATPMNDEMEAHVVHDMFGPDVACSSTKGMTGHLLAAAGSNEVAFLISALASKTIPRHYWDGIPDPALPAIRLVDEVDQTFAGRYVMSCSYAFGGNNAVVVLAGG